MRYFRNIILIFLTFISHINKLIPKKNIIIFFTNNQESNDNNIALLNKIIEHKLYKQYKIYFFSKDKRKYGHHKHVTYKGTLLAPLYFLLAKYCFYDCGTLKITPSKNQFVISLWHGIPLKKIGRMLNEQSSKLDTYNDFTYILVPSPRWKQLYKQCFGCTNEQILINGFPRNDFLFHPNATKLQLLNLNTHKKTNILWMPTFRKSLNGR